MAVPTRSSRSSRSSKYTDETVDRWYEFGDSMRLDLLWPLVERLGTPVLSRGYLLILFHSESCADTFEELCRTHSTRNIRDIRRTTKYDAVPAMSATSDTSDTSEIPTAAGLTS